MESMHSRVLLRRKDHPLATSHGRVRRSRMVLWEQFRGKDSLCHWCGIPVEWEYRGRDMTDHDLVVDHLDGNVRNDALTNLVPSCRSCNGARMKVKALCKVCGEPFNRLTGGQQYCSERCSRPFKYSDKTCPVCKVGLRKRVEQVTCSNRCGALLRWHGV